MISYRPFWHTLANSDETWYSLTKRHKISSSTLHRLKMNEVVTTKTLNDLCRILNCQIQDVVEYLPSDQDQTL